MCLFIAGDIGSILLKLPVSWRVFYYTNKGILLKESNKVKSMILHIHFFLTFLHNRGLIKYSKWLFNVYIYIIIPYILLNIVN